jgi:hypothetical protein
MPTETPIGYPNGLPYPAMERGAEVDSHNEETEMESGRIRTRRTAENDREMLNLNWNFHDDQFELFERWVKYNLENGKKPFRLTGVLDDRMEIFNLAFFPAGLYTVGHTDNHYQVSATCEVIE